MDLADISRILLAFIAVVGFIGAAAAIVRKTGLAAGARAFANKRRLSIAETLPIDARRRAVIIRCDGRDHLVLLGQTGEMLITADLPSHPAADEETPRGGDEPAAAPATKADEPVLLAELRSARDAA